VETGEIGCGWCYCKTRADSPGAQYSVQRSDVWLLVEKIKLIVSWVDQFTKLHLWKLTEYERVVYMDSDLFPLINTEELFSMDIRQKSTTKPPFDYSFAAAPNLVGVPRIIASASASFFGSAIGTCANAF